MAELLKPVKVSFRIHLFICSITVLTGYSYSLIANPMVKLVTILVFLIAAEAMVFLWTNYFLRSFAQSIKLFSGRDETISWINVPEFTRLAKRMKVRLNKRNPIGIKKGVDNAYSNALTNRVVIGEELFNRLGKREKLALMAHELTHIKENHWMPGLIPVLVLVLFHESLLTSGTPPIVAILTATAAYIVFLVFTNWSAEFSADSGATLQIGPKPTTSLLRKVVPFDS